MRVRFWGTRGSLAKPGPTTLRYGGNTACVEVRGSDGTLVVLDCGTGAHALGLALLAEAPTPRRGHLLITHTHWDHIQGFPFFGPLFTPGQEWDIYAPGGLGQRLEGTLAGQMEYTYFPVTLERLEATIRFHDLAEGAFAIGPIRVIGQYLNHPALTLGYRLEADGAAIVYAVDHEPHRGREPGGDAAQLGIHHEDQRHIEFLRGADLVIHDAQYTEAEYGAKVGWGHTPIERAVDYGLAARARRLALFHHDPLRDDAQLEHQVAGARARVRAAGGSLDVFAAAEGDVFEVADPSAGARPAGVTRPPLPRERPAPASAAASTLLPDRTILVADDDPGILRLLTMVLQPEGFRLLTAGDGDTALALARAERPSLVLIDWQMPGRSGLEVARALRADADPGLREVPVVMITGRNEAESTAAGFAVGVTDYLAKPFTPGQVRSRVRAWLMRERHGGDGRS
jgi:CheY-like chemotaxis protein